MDENWGTHIFGNLHIYPKNMSILRRPHGLGPTPRPQYAMMQRPDSVKKEWLNGQSTGNSNGHPCLSMSIWSNPSEKCGSNKSNGDWTHWMEHRTIYKYIYIYCIYIYMFFLLFFKHFVTIQIWGGPVNFPFRTIPFVAPSNQLLEKIHRMDVTQIRCRRRPQTCLDGRWWMVNTCHWSGGPQGHTAPAGRIGAIIIIIFFRSSKGWMGQIFLLGVS